MSKFHKIINLSNDFSQTAIYSLVFQNLQSVLPSFNAPPIFDTQCSAVLLEFE